MKQVLKLTLEDTKKMMDGAINKAIEIGIDMDIAIVDDGGHLMLFTRMDNAKITSINISIDKAFTAAAARKANALNDAARSYTNLYYKSLASFNRSIDSDFGYLMKKTSQPIARGKGRKHDYSDLTKAFDKFSATLEKYDGRNLTSEIELGVLNCIEIWNKAITEYVPKKRKARIGDKIIGQLYFNLAYAHFVLRDWGNVYEKLSKANERKGLKRFTLSTMEAD